MLPFYPMSLLAAAFPVLRRRVRRAFGASVGVHASIPSDLRDDVGGQVVALEVAADASGGALTLDLRRPDGAPLTGQVPAGLLFAVGDAELQIAQLAKVDDNLLSIALAEPLGVALSAGDAVTVATSAEFPLGDAIEQGYKIDPMREYAAVPSGELQIPTAGMSPFVRLEERTILLIGRPVLPYADPEASEDPSPATSAERVQIAAVLLRLDDVVCVAYGSA